MYPHTTSLGGVGGGGGGGGVKNYNGLDSDPVGVTVLPSKQERSIIL